ncbi:atypical kinase COQ8B, mitochondrial isoform X1 [Neodiprion fabricii]|uniref:atypical kinase COQ8B, mitochondrial isoform X1 n=1 Tax=Neodiprion fabricii TaxID=2872261 RepID=UPI001ED95A27|nr:atypical kinase COQ8B, mitochondrial isoform X1 [Neodiprion fabricii]
MIQADYNVHLTAMSRPWTTDFLGVVRGAQAVANAVLKIQGDSIKQAVTHSSLRNLAEDNLKAVGKQLENIDPSKVPNNVAAGVKETLERVSVLGTGITRYVAFRTSSATGYCDALQQKDHSKSTSSQNADSVPNDDNEGVPGFQKSASSRGETETRDEIKTPVSPKKFASVKEKIETIATLGEDIPKIELSNKDKKLLRKLELEHEERIRRQKPEGNTILDPITDSKGSTLNKEIINSNDSKESTESKKNDSTVRVHKAMPSVRPRQSLSANARQRKVPSTRFQRVVSFGTLGLGLGIGTMAEYTRRTLGFKNQSVSQSLDSMFLTKANTERIVSTLCKVRGAGLKIGQILSIQDNSIISPELQKAFERVRQSADFMPTWQVEKVLSNELGSDWRSKLSSFEDKPFAAASIGQVHNAVLLDGTPVAMKIQYPGVAEGIQSDIDNLVSVLKIWNIFPEGMFIDNVVEVAKRELAWEVDYVREAECTRKYRDLISPYSDYYVPKVIDEFSTKQIFTSELIDGIPVDKCAEMDSETREHICKMVMRLCLLELFDFRYMQTDPNWANFFYNPETRQLTLLDFGACRAYDKRFMDQYIEIIKGASEGDREKVLQLSRQMGFLTGYESKVMDDAHVDAVMILGQVFDEKHEYFDFGGQDVTKRIQTLIPTILNHRLCPPPEEIYSLHRKLSGVFLLCAKLNVKINCRDLFQEVYRNYQFD